MHEPIGCIGANDGQDASRMVAKPALAQPRAATPLGDRTEETHFPAEYVCGSTAARNSEILAPCMERSPLLAAPTGLHGIAGSVGEQCRKKRPAWACDHPPSGHREHVPQNRRASQTSEHLVLLLPSAVLPEGPHIWRSHLPCLLSAVGDREKSSRYSRGPCLR